MKYLYKYRPFNKHTIKIVLNNEIYFSNPKDFNDPFDCQIVLDFSESKKDWAEIIRNKLKEENPRIPDEKIDSLIQYYFKSINTDKEVEEKFHKIRDELMKNISMYCLSEVNNDILMFSHYADSHKGICLEFDASGGTIFSKALRVNYVNVYPKVKFTKSNFYEQGKTMLLTKFDTWSHEKEWRIVNFKTGSGIRRFPPEKLTGIILGCQFPDSELDFIFKILKSRMQKINLYQAKKVKYKFLLNIEPINIT